MSSFSKHRVRIPNEKTASSFLFDWQCLSFLQFSSVQSLSRVRLFATPWTAACQASLSTTMSIFWHCLSSGLGWKMTFSKFAGILRAALSQHYLLGFEIAQLKFQYFGHLMQRANSLENTLMLGKIEGRRRWGLQRMRWLDGIPTQWTWVWEAPRDGKGQGSLACCSPWGCKNVGMTERLNNNKISTTV